MMTIDEYMRPLEHAREHTLPGHETIERDEMLRALQRRLRDTHERAPRPRAAIRLRLVRD
jgi:hypothetical protein